MEAFAFEAGFFSVFEADFVGNNLASWDLILAALFLWMTFVFADLSASEIASIILAAVLDFLAARTATSRRLTRSLFTDSFLILPRRALFAVFVTGIQLIFRL